MLGSLLALEQAQLRGTDIPISTMAANKNDEAAYGGLSSHLCFMPNVHPI
jgi:hypothetical protein